MSYVTFFPSGEKCFAEKGKSILDIAFENLIEIDHNCAGVAACTSCRIIVKEGSEYLNGISEDELFYFLSADDRFELESIQNFYINYLKNVHNSIEIIKPLKNYEKYYNISSNGYVISLRSGIIF